MNVTVYFPTTADGMRQLQKAVAEIHANAVLKAIDQLHCSQKQKEQLLADIKDLYRQIN